MSDGSYLRSLRENALEGDVPVFDAVQARFVLGSGSSATRSDLDIYIDPAAGNDSNPGTQALPIQSFERADQMTALVIDHVVQWHLKAATYTMPARGHWLSSRIIRAGRLRVFADEAWDPAVYTTALTGTCDAGTSQTQVVVTGGGLTPNALANKTIEILDGPAAGWRMDIVSNTATTIRGSCGWDMGKGVAVPVAGNSFRVFDANGCTVLLPPNAAAVDPVAYEIVQRTLGGSRDSTRAYNSLPGAVIFEGFRIGGTDETEVEIGSVSAQLCVMFGVTLLTTMQIGAFEFWGDLMLLGYADSILDENNGLHREWHGWGLRCQERAPVANNGSVIRGFLNMQDSTKDMSVGSPYGGSWEVLGGRIGRLFSGTSGCRMRLVKEFFDDAVQPKMYSSPNPSVFFNFEPYTQQASCEIRGVEVPSMGAEISIRGAGCTAIIHGSDRNSIQRSATPGLTVFEFEDGVRVRIVGVPTGLTQSTGGTPQTDWLIDGVAVDPLVAFANNGDFILGARGTLVRRLD